MVARQKTSPSLPEKRKSLIENSLYRHLGQVLAENPSPNRGSDDGEKIYFRFEWVPPKNGDVKMDKKNEVKLAMMFDGGGTVDEGADLNGCWGTCHSDLRGMKDAKDDKKTKYIKGADLAGGKFMDLMQYRSGKGEKPVDGHVADKRVMEGGKALVKAQGRQGRQQVGRHFRTQPRRRRPG